MWAVKHKLLWPCLRVAQHIQFVETPEREVTLCVVHLGEGGGKGGGKVTTVLS